MASHEWIADPWQMMEQWLAQAKFDTPTRADDLTIASSDSQGKASVRVVYYKGIREGGVSFFTNYLGRKGRELLENPWASGLFFHAEVRRQIRLEGEVVKLSAAGSDAYFATRQRPSQIGAWASRQSAPLESRELLLERFAEYEARFEGKEVPRPEWWGGFVLHPQRFEFWQGLADRLHERMVYEKAGDTWVKGLIYP